MPIPRVLGMSVSRVGRTLSRGLQAAPFRTSVKRRADTTVPFKLPDPRNEPNNTGRAPLNARNSKQPCPGSVRSSPSDPTFSTISSIGYPDFNYDKEHISNTS
ncbi:hypothetical protein CEP54_000027 [Fusarium duplospermum]|uniref:Uncharacterized protein n=1 Tax=Fusarium duplospermum TaxID=1325734 RepID=A0A428R8I4_9HYPO|nr:hypothetical protein CEP54_000027 [Fusarium duplospermum]